MMSYNITPVPKPRMTRRDKWKPRPSVVRYWAFKDLCRKENVWFESGCHVTFVMPMPKSWSGTKRQRMDGKPHQQVPDLDNLVKALNDALYSNDSKIWDFRATKVWGYEGLIIVTSIE